MAYESRISLLSRNDFPKFSGLGKGLKSRVESKMAAAPEGVHQEHIYNIIYMKFLTNIHAWYIIWKLLMCTLILCTKQITLANLHIANLHISHKNCENFTLRSHARTLEIIAMALILSIKVFLVLDIIILHNITQKWDQNGN
jgi:hypothetical protein